MKIPPWAKLFEANDPIIVDAQLKNNGNDRLTVPVLRLIILLLILLLLLCRIFQFTSAEDISLWVPFL